MSFVSSEVQRKMPLASFTHREFSRSLISFVRQWIVVMRNPSRFRCAVVTSSPIFNDWTRTVAFHTGSITIACIVVTKVRLAKLRHGDGFPFSSRRGHSFGVIDYQLPEPKTEMNRYEDVMLQFHATKRHAVTDVTWSTEVLVLIDADMMLPNHVLK